MVEISYWHLFWICFFAFVAGFCLCATLYGYAKIKEEEYVLSHRETNEG